MEAPLKTTILGGILFLAPLAILAILVTKIYQISFAIAGPLDKLIPIETFAGVAFVNILAILLIVLICYLFGLLARFTFLKTRLQRLDSLLIDLIPTYAIFKGIASNVAEDEGLKGHLKPVIARFDDYEQIAFEFEKGENYSVVFLPGSPSVWSGASVIVEQERIRYLDISIHHAMKLLRVFGRGSLEVHAKNEGGEKTALQPPKLPQAR